ncbi:MAG: proteasome subunit beta [Candidatus Nanoarchaeia archaeon]|nr:proteasome subunit beta [Candidatus Nanoarchaeia archaeon]
MEEKVLKTGTTTIGIVCKDGIVMAADKRATAGYMVAEKKMDKVFQIDDYMAVTTAGSVSEVQLLLKLIKAQIRLTKMRSRKSPTVKELTNLLATYVYSNIRRPSMLLAVTGFLVGGKDSTGYSLYEVGVDGSLIKADDYRADGSGSVFALGVLENEYKKDINVKQGIELALKAVNAALKRDAATGNGVDVITITTEGYKKVVEKEINTGIY